MSTILVAEQDFSLRARLANGLRQRGHHVNEACGGVEALQQLEQCLFEAILTDFRLPEKSGIEVLHMAQTADEVTPVFILTDPEDIPSAFELLRLGAYDYLLNTPPSTRRRSVSGSNERLSTVACCRPPII